VQARIAAEENDTRDRARSEPLANLVDRRVQHGPAAGAEREKELHRAIVLEVRDGDADERQPFALDPRPAPR
jgi:hypothetical protein